MPKDIDDIWSNDEDDTQEFNNETIKSSNQIFEKEKKREDEYQEELDKAYLRSLRFRKD